MKRFTVAYILIFCLIKPQLIYGQGSILDRKINISIENKSLEACFKEISKITGINFTYNPNIIPSDDVININAENNQIKQILEEILPDFLFYELINNQIVIYKNKNGNTDTIYQNIRGTVIDKDTHVPLTGVTIYLSDSSKKVGTISDGDGNYCLKNIEVGRCGISVSSVGYKPQRYNNLKLISGKELIIDIELEKNIEELTEVIVSANTEKEHALNNMATVSIRTFTVEETEKYAGSWGDPARMASNFAGVSIVGDGRNDIIVRGNSPLGLIWKLDGIPIPSPNHWDMIGTTGGPVSILNNNQLSKSEFFTSAFPAEYGNGIAGVFDLKLRNGNNQKREYVAQIGFNGFELGAEGPFLNNGKSTFLVNYRYSMLGLIDDLLWINALPHYQDISFKINCPIKSGNVSLFGIGGSSYIYFEKGMVSLQNGDTKMFREDAGSKTGVLGINFEYFINDNLRIKNSFSISTRRPYYYHDSLINNAVSRHLAKCEDTENNYIISSKLIHRFNNKNTVDIGLSFLNYSFNRYVMDYDIFYIIENGWVVGNELVVYDPYERSKNNLSLLQNYLQWKHYFTNNLKVTSGLFYQQFLYNNKKSIEPRAGLKWQINERQSLCLGYGFHSQIQPLFFYFAYKQSRDSLGNDIYTNFERDLDLTKSHQFVIGYNWYITDNWKFKTETYYHQLYNIPIIEKQSYSIMLDVGTHYYFPSRDSILTNGTGENYGIEFTLEKILSNNYYLLLTTSIFNSSYQGNDGIKRNSAFNRNFVINTLAGYEVSVGKNCSLDFNLRLAYAGGRRIIPINLNVSQYLDTEVYDYKNAFEQKVKNYFRMDGRISFIYQSKKITHEIALDMTNFTNNKNELFYEYNIVDKQIDTFYQQGIFPMGLYRISF